MPYAQKDSAGKLTGRWFGAVESKDKRFRRLFETKKLAEGYEIYVRLMCAEPPGLEGASVTGKTFTEVAEECRSAGGPRGAWLRERDPSVFQRLDYLKEKIGALDIASVSAKTLEDVSKGLAKKPGQRKGSFLSNATINRYLTTASAVLTYACDKDYISKKPKVPLLKEISKLRPILSSVDQERSILGWLEANGEHVAATQVRVLVETGLREGELEHLRRDQIIIDQTENGWINLEAEHVKNDTARKVYIRAALAKELRALMARGPLLKAWQLLRKFKRAVKAVGGPENLVIHSLRHTRNTRLRRQGVDIKIRMQMLGHKTISTSMRYDHTDEQDQLEAAKKVEQSVGGSVQTGEVVRFDDAKKSA